MHMFERIKFEVEMSSLGRVIPADHHHQLQYQRQKLNGVNCYDCMLLCWKTVQSLHNQLSVVSSVCQCAMSEFSLILSYLEFVQVSVVRDTSRRGQSFLSSAPVSYGAPASYPR